MNIDKQKIVNGLNIIGRLYIETLIKNLLLLDKVASGRLLKSLDFFVVETLNGCLLTIVYDQHMIYVDQGRRPGKFPPPDAIKKWMKDKNIHSDSMTDDQLAFLIGRKIAKEGIKPTDVLKDTYDEIYDSIYTIIDKNIDININI